MKHPFPSAARPPFPSPRGRAGDGVNNPRLCLMNKNEEIPRQTREKLIECAREMRKTPTLAESLLWNELRKEKLVVGWVANPPNNKN